MKTKIFFVSSLLMAAVLVAACGSQPVAIPETVEDAIEDAATLVPNSTEVIAVQTAVGDDVESLAEALRTAGVTVESGDEIEQPFFTVAGQVLKVNGADVQVFVYDTAEAMEAEATQVAEDGGSVGTNMVNWVESPHFYKFGRTLVLYVGEDPTVKSLLEGIFGPQFAGR